VPFVCADSHHVVIAAWAVLDEKEERLIGDHVPADCLDRSTKTHRGPSTIANGVGEHVAAYPTRSSIDQQFELLDIGVSVAPVPENHRGSGATA